MLADAVDVNEPAVPDCGGWSGHGGGRQVRTRPRRNGGLGFAPTRLPQNRREHLQGLALELGSDRAFAYDSS